MKKQEYFQKRIEEETSTKQKLFYAATLLFSEKGYSNVGIRELCRTVNVKESAFYNHYGSKDELFGRILAYFREQSSRVVFGEEEIEAAVNTGDVRTFLVRNMEKFAQFTGDPLYHTILQIVLMESYIHPEAKAIAGFNLYHIRKDYTEKVLERMMHKGSIKQCNVRVVTAEYYYALKGLLDEYLLLEVWNEKTEPVNQKISEHIDFFADLLRP